MADTRTVFISGAAAGIGRATALAFARRGYRVGAYDIDRGQWNAPLHHALVGSDSAYAGAGG